MARPRVDIKQHELEALCRMNPTLKDTAAFFKVSEDTIENRCKEFGYTGFSDCRDKNMVDTRFKLIRKAIKKAEQGDNVMLIFCLKNLCGWADRVEKINDDEKTINIIMDGKNESSRL